MKPSHLKARAHAKLLAGSGAWQPSPDQLKNLARAYLDIRKRRGDLAQMRKNLRMMLIRIDMILAEKEEETE